MVCQVTINHEDVKTSVVEIDQGSLKIVGVSFGKWVLRQCGVDGGGVRDL